MLSNKQWLTYLRRVNELLKEKREPHTLSELRYYVFNTIWYEGNARYACTWGIKAISRFPHMDYLRLHNGEFHITYEDVYNIVKGLV